MYWVIQENMRNDSAEVVSGQEEFKSALRELRIEHGIVNLVPFSHEMRPDPLIPSGRVVTFGSISMSEVARARDWTPGCWLNENFDQRIWTAEYGTHCLNADAEFYALEDILPFDGLRFMRPVHDLKSMTGCLVDYKWVKEQQDHFSTISVHFKESRRTLCHDTPVSMSIDKDIDHEARFFIVNGSVLAGSYYRIRGANHGERTRLEKRITLRDHNGSWDFAQSMAELWNPAPAYVIDIAEIYRDRFSSDDRPDHYVIEINCINHSGFYSADMRPVILAIESLS